LAGVTIDFDQATIANMTAAQRAMATAMIYPKAEQAHRGKRSEQAKLLEAKSFSSARLSQARTVLQRRR